MKLLALRRVLLATAFGTASVYAAAQTVPSRIPQETKFKNTPPFAAVFAPAYVYTATGAVHPQAREETKRKAAPVRARLKVRNVRAQTPRAAKRKKAHATVLVRQKTKRKSAQPAVLKIAADHTVPTGARDETKLKTMPFAPMRIYIDGVEQKTEPSASTLAAGDRTQSESTGALVDSAGPMTMAADGGPPPDERQLPGRLRVYVDGVEQVNDGAVRAPPPDAFPEDHIPIPDRWRLVDSLGVKARWFDPYNQNELKGDRPLFGSNWFLNLSAISDTVIEPRSFPTPVGVQTTERPNSLDTIGHGDSFLFSQTLLLGASFINGSTAFKPPTLEFRFAVAFNYNYAEVSERRILSVNPGHHDYRHDNFIGVQEAFVDYHIRNVSERYDFDSIRIGIQPFSSDFRGFLFQDNQLGVRLFGDRDNNRYQYNLAGFARLEKDTNSGLNDLGQDVRKDYVAVANFYAQDLPIPGFVSQLTAAYNRNDERGEIHIDENGFPARPSLIGNLRTRDYDVVYLGYNGDGHFGRVNLTLSAYGALGEDRNSIFTMAPADIRSWFVALEPSYDLNWMRFRLSGLYASGDDNPNDNVEQGFDAIFENPQFAGADTSYWIRQSIPFIGGGRAVFLNGRNGVLNSLRSSKEEGQSNFNNPGTILLGGGADFDVLPELRVSANINHMWFANTAIVKTLRQEGSVSDDLGWDYSLSTTWRPHLTQNIVLRASGAVLQPGAGFGDLFADNRGADTFYSVLLNAILTY